MPPAAISRPLDLDITKTTIHGIRNNKRWYAAWSNNFADGSPEKNALTGVDTEEGANPPTAKEIATLTQSGSSVAVIYVDGGGNGAVSLMLQWQVSGVDADFGHDTPVILTGQTVGPFPAGHTISFRVRAINAAGTTDSAVQTSVIPSSPTPP